MGSPFCLVLGWASAVGQEPTAATGSFLGLAVSLNDPPCRGRVDKSARLAVRHGSAFAQSSSLLDTSAVPTSHACADMAVVAGFG